MNHRIGIAGVGGIGSNVAMQLVRAGHSCLRLVDFDRVEFSNLNRQFYFHDQIGRPKVECLRENLLRIDPAAAIEVVQLQLDGANMEKVFRDCPVVIEGFDGAVDKKQLLEIFGRTKKSVIAASGIAGANLNGIRMRNIGGAHVVGDFISDCREHILYAPKISIIGAMMADLALQALGNLGTQTIR